MDGFGNFVADVQAEDELPDNEKAQNESEEVTGEEEDSASKIDTSITIGTGSRIAVVSKATDGEYWKLVHWGMEDAVKDINTAYDFSSNDAVTMTFEGPSDEQDVETQINTLDAVIAENPTVLCMSASDIESCQAQLEAASENGIPVVVFDSNVNEDELVAAFRGTDNTYVGKLAAEKLADAIGGSGKIAVFSAQEKTESSQKRVEGFKETLMEYPDITIVSELYTDKVDDMETAMADVLNRYPDLSGVFCTNEDVSDLYLSLDKGEKAPVMVGVDATTVQQKAIADGQELGTISADLRTMTVYDIASDLDYTVKYTAPNRYKVTYGADDDAAGVVDAVVAGSADALASGDKQLQGSDIVFTATPNEGYEIAYWEVNGEKVDAEAEGADAQRYELEYLGKDTKEMIRR